MGLRFVSILNAYCDKDSRNLAFGDVPPASIEGPRRVFGLRLPIDAFDDGFDVSRCHRLGRIRRWHRRDVPPTTESSTVDILDAHTRFLRR